MKIENSDMEKSMVEVPEEPTVLTADYLADWYKMAQELKSLRAKVILMRKRIFTLVFPDPKEGTNSFGLDDGYVLKGQYTLERTVDEGAFNALREQLREENMNPDTLTHTKLLLVKRIYNKLTAEQKSLFDQCLIIKPGSPSIEIVLPAKNKKD